MLVQNNGGQRDIHVGIVNNNGFKSTTNVGKAKVNGGKSDIIVDTGNNTGFQSVLNIGALQNMMVDN